MELPPNTTARLVPRTSIVDGEKVTADVVQCIPDMQYNTLTLKSVGGSSKITLQASAVAKGVDLRAVHAYNLQSGWLSGDIETAKAKASQAASLRATKANVRELVACNKWQYFVTITFSSEKWDRDDLQAIQYAIKECARKWRNMQVNKERPYKDFRYLFIPEYHQKGGVHLHGLVSLIPGKYLVPYTMDDVNSEKRLPREIVEKVKAGDEIYHCSYFDEVYGYNVIEPVRSPARLSSYITKYLTKDLGRVPAKTRVWRSRGLHQASIVGQYHISGSGTAVDDAMEYMRSVASRDSQGRPLYHEHYMPIDLGEGVTAQAFRGASALVNAEDRPQDQIKQDISMFGGLRNE